ncbi:long-chain-fatty-acid--CoA ligase [Novosphingobium sp. FSY-8]|uniref:Long-chain-fatty-acid--CoA ligase n=1 Tax=Novosphingobium ovatum TaxID=1908523 RepID=A0ABW9XBH3_9SPHN|nr:long-chain fatty acid--CoA ligase [Novosphingobium ovatum]NBC35876.1 long-chain-fatty-acid--CoA ligase [Novosphingobium ovatum]
MGTGMQDWPLRIGTIIDHAERQHATREIVSRSCEGPITRTTYAQVAQRSRRLAGALIAMGIQPGDRVATLAWNNARHLECWYGISGAGAVCHTVNPRLYEEQIAFIINDADDQVIFADLTFVALLEKVADRCLAGRKLVLLTDRAHMPTDTTLDLICYEELLESGDPATSWVEVDENAPAGLCYTSGTTGAPKGVVYTHRSNILHALMMHGGNALALTERSVVMPVVPMCHANAWTLAFSAPMTGAKLVLPGPKMDGGSLVELIHGEGVTMSAGVPTVWIDVAARLKESGRGTLRRVITAGSACPRWMMGAFDDLGVELVHAWGMTELSPLGSFAPLRAEMDDWDDEAKLNQRLKQGAAPYGVDLRLVDDAGTELPRDGVTGGRLQARGPAVVSEYFKGAGGKVLDDEGWFNTGDIATIDAHGFVQITDRTKDVIKSGGEWISSIELENEASSHPAIREAAAIGLPHDRWGERPMLVCVRREGAHVEAHEVLEWLRDKVAKWWLPDAIVFADDLPHTATGKLDKVTLRKRYEGFTLS